MNWLIWKQHGKQFVVLAVLLALYTAIAIPVGIHFWHEYQQARLACQPVDTCGQLSTILFQGGWESNFNPSLPSGGVNIVVLLILALPYLLGIFIGVPLISREYTAGTNLLIWTRGIARRRWLTVKLAWILGATAVFAGVFAVITTWWSRTGNALYLDRFDTFKFGLQGITPVAYALFAVALGIALGAWLKRTMAAIGVGLVVLLALQITVAGFVRQHYMAPLTKTIWTEHFGPGLDTALAPQGALIMTSQIIDGQGHVLSWADPPQQCVVSLTELARLTSGESHRGIDVAGGDGTIVTVNNGPTVKGSCLQSIGYHYKIQYHPANRYWAFQLIETSAYLGFSALLIGATYWLVLKRDA